MLKSARKTTEKDPEGRMPLAEHLRELRNRLAKSLLAVVVTTVFAFFFYKDILQFFTDPILQAVGCKLSLEELQETGTTTCARIVQNGLLSPFTLALSVSFTSGLVLASPVWLYQLWGFIAPGLHKNEKKYSLGIVGAGFPLFLLGAYFAYWSLPKMAEVMLQFSIIGSDNQLPLDELIQLIMRMIIIFGLAFELPLLLVVLNFGGIVSGAKMLSWWRGMVMGITLFAAIATPSTDPVSMLALAAPISVLYFVATGVAIMNDRRRARIEAAGPADDEASDLDLTPEDIGEIETVSASPALPEQASSDRDRINGFDDVT